VNLVDALQAALAGEHAAVYAYGVVGAHLEGLAGERGAQAGYDAHRQRRTVLTGLLVQAGAQPTPAAVAYQLGPPVTGPVPARALAAQVESKVAQTYADLVFVAGEPLRSTAAGWLADAAVRQASWSGRAAAFPGLAELPG
jgi:Domain of unknown function (DUF4439)